MSITISNIAKQKGEEILKILSGLSIEDARNSLEQAGGLLGMIIAVQNRKIIIDLKDLSEF